MKCIKYYRDHGGHVIRTTDKHAALEVSKGIAIYAPKSWFKAAKLKGND